MKKYTNLLLTIIFGLSIYSCDKFIEPLPEDGKYNTDQLQFNPAFMEGLLIRAYISLPNNYEFQTDVATDDAVTNLIGSPYSRLATGEWKASNNAISKWHYAYEQIYYINLFLENYKKVQYASDPRLTPQQISRKDSLHKKRLSGEAHGLRAWYESELLRYHSGVDANGNLLGFPILRKALKTTDDWQLERNTFAECVDAIMRDLDTAINNLPSVYADGTDPLVNETSGIRFENRMNGNAARALRSRVALLAASPAFAASNAVTWEETAVIAGDLLSDLPALFNQGITFYRTIRNNEIIWNQSQRQIRSWEQENFPPSLLGNGRTNPSQNLVDAFPMKNGYPISHTLSGYNPGDPYMDRDARFTNYIVFNGSSLKGQPVNTHIDAALDGINTLATSTRTGYYLKKFMNEAVNLNPNSPANSAHNYTLFRVTEVLLNFAEAANEAWGPEGDPHGYGFSAKSKIAELRLRAGITPDNYLASISDKEALRDLIRNERRLELCFEEFRFWDIRRWNLVTVMTQPANGMFITQDTGVDTTYEVRVVESRIFTQDMIYGPIPYDETRKYDLEQNKGW